uniref:Uncharacterized protein n=1 Tax=Cacopsylla melanoneura TaxID=428564 RepID=A0A8D9F6W7_9HEMI
MYTVSTYIEVLHAFINVFGLINTDNVNHRAAIMCFLDSIQKLSSEDYLTFSQFIAFSSMCIITNFVQRWFLINRNRPCPETRSKCDVGKTTYPTLMASEERLRVQVPPKSCFHPTLSMPNIEIRSCDQIW